MPNTDFYHADKSTFCNGVLKLMGITPVGQAPTQQQVQEVDVFLRFVLKELNGYLKCLWKYDQDAITMNGASSYNISAGLNSNIHRIVTAYYRDTTGKDTPVEVVDVVRYVSARSKNEIGPPVMCYLNNKRVLTAQVLYVHPAPTDGVLNLIYEATIQVPTDPSDSLDVPAEWQRYVLLKTATMIGFRYGVNVNRLAFLDQQSDKILQLLIPNLMYDFEKVRVREGK